MVCKDIMCGNMCNIYISVYKNITIVYYVITYTVIEINYYI